MYIEYSSIFELYKNNNYFQNNIETKTCNWQDKLEADWQN